jgi:hypothetical protein
MTEACVSTVSLAMSSRSPTQLFHLSRDETTMQMVDLTVSNHKAPVKLAEAFPCKKPSDRPFSEIDKL